MNALRLQKHSLPAKAVEIFHPPHFSPMMVLACGFADIDLDQDLEMLVSGQAPGDTDPILTPYANNGDGIFSEVLDLPFIGIAQSL